jgi:hypothetical protein
MAVNRTCSRVNAVSFSIIAQIVPEGLRRAKSGSSAPYDLVRQLQTGSLASVRAAHGKVVTNVTTLLYSMYYNDIANHLQ